MGQLKTNIKKFKASKECEGKSLFEWPKEEQERFFRKVADDACREKRRFLKEYDARFPK